MKTTEMPEDAICNADGWPLYTQCPSGCKYNRGEYCIAIQEMRDSHPTQPISTPRQSEENDPNNEST